MSRIFFIIPVFLLLVSCTADIRKDITVSLFEDLTWEQVTGKPMWYKIRYFDGESVNTRYLGNDEKKSTFSVIPSSLSVFALYPLGTLSPFGGFWEEGEGTTVYLDSATGYFASMLLDAAETMPQAVSEVSVRAIMKKNPDLGALNRTEFLSRLFQGTLSSGKLSLSRKYSVPLDSVLSGYWVSLFSHQSSFTLRGKGDGRTLSLLPGIWYYLNTERDMILEIVITDDGEYRIRHKAAGKWS